VPETPRRHVLRGLLAGTVATALALAAHYLGGGPVPRPLGLLTPWLLSVQAAVLLLGRRRSPVRLALAAGTAQALFHALFALGAAGSAASHAHHGPVVLTVDPVGRPMWAWHAVAALVTAGALQAGGSARARLGEALARLVGLRLPRPTWTPAPSRAVPVPLLAARRTRPAPLSSLSRRGPPVVLVP